MPNPFEHVIKIVTAKVKRVLPQLILWLVLSVGSAVVASQFISDDVVIHSIGIGAGFLLLLWWFLLRWLLGSQWALDLQKVFVDNQMIPFNFVRFTGNMPWSVSSNKERLIRSCAGEYRTLLEKVKTANQTLEKYVGSSVTEMASKKALQSELGGELRRVYVLFSDVRGFTHMTEMLKPEETVEILNKMFQAMEEVITQNGGDINKYIGDAIMAYFRRPYGNEGEAAKMVLRTAMRMQDRFELLNQSFKVAYSQEVKIGLGIGITAGEAILGNLGSTNRMEFTLIGDTVNLASRLCGIAEHGQVLVNEEMAEAAKDFFEMTALAPVQDQGKVGAPDALRGLRRTVGDGPVNQMKLGVRS